MGWNFKTLNKIEKPSTTTCSVDEVIEILKNKYKGIPVDLLEKITVDVLIKNLTEHKMDLESIKKKYSDIKEIEEIINEILRINEDLSKKRTTEFQ